MRSARACTLLSLNLIAALAGPGEAAPPAVADLVKAELAAETISVAPGSTLWLDAHLDIAPGWHVYWRNPGDAGLPTAIAWTLPPGFTAGAIEWPVPERFKVGPIANYGYTGAADLLMPVTVPATLEPSAAVRLDAKIDYLVCAEICIPGETKLGLALPVGARAELDPAAAGRFAAARQRLPAPAPFAVSFAAEPHDLRLIVPAAALAGLDQPAASFFPDDDNVIDHSAEPKVAVRRGGLELVMAKSASPTATVPAALNGVLVLNGADGTRRGYTVSAARAVAAAPADGGLPAWWQALLFAFVGGLILNLMPCVFPILSLKVLSLAGADPAKRHHHGAAYAVGVVLSFAALGAALLALRAGGAAIGWGFQLQSPVVVGLLAYLMLAMGLSLSGVAEFGVRFASAGSRLTDKRGLAGAFFTGVLAAVVATPCTAPFMGAALGAALIAPAPLALAIFVALGAGLAAPLLLASYLPAIARILPRPGGWMELLKQVLAFPLYGTVAWLVWVLMQEVGPEAALAALFGLVLVGFAVWVYGRTQLAAPGARRLGRAFAIAGVAAAMALVTILTPIGPPAGAREPAATARGGLVYQPFSEARLSALTVAHTPVFVNLTAAWCLTCIVNERATLDRASVREAFAARGIIALKGDWTRRDPEIAAFLQSFGRSGVPLYLLYNGDGAATVLPQILTEGSVLEAVERL